MLNQNAVFDIIGIGFGPSNLALAIALEEMQADVSTLFLEKCRDSIWQAGMLLDGSDIQNNPLRDLVTPRNPRSQYTFVNYLKETGRLFDYLNLGIHYPLRKDYAKYIAWVEQHFHDWVKYSTPVNAISITDGMFDQANVWKIHTSQGSEYNARCLVIGTGRTPNIPEIFRPFLSERVFHLNHYCPNISKLNISNNTRIAVLGSSQSAVEILLDLTRRNSHAKIYSIHRSFSFRLKDTSPFSDLVYFPEFLDYFYSISKNSKRDLSRQLKPTNYSSADGDIIHKLYLQLYEEKLDDNHRFTLLNNTIVKQISKSGNEYLLSTSEIHTEVSQEIAVDAIVLATGFLNFGTGSGFEAFPPILEGVKQVLPLDEDGVIEVGRDYAVKLLGKNLPLLYLNGLCESTHGLGDAGSFSLLSLRAQVIADSILRQM
jgi:L-ornithine N5-oxygenase